MSTPRPLALRAVLGAALAVAMLVDCAAPRPRPVPLGAEAYRHGAYALAWDAWSHRLDTSMRAPRRALGRPGGGVAVSIGTATPRGSVARALPAIPAASLLAPPTTTQAPAPSLRIAGVVRSTTDDSAVVVTSAGLPVAVDLSAMAVPARVLFQRGRHLAVWRLWTDGALAARGVGVDYGGWSRR
jgi:hypothetical protein